jgi:hypothetical protein
MKTEIETLDEQNERGGMMDEAPVRRNSRGATRRLSSAPDERLGVDNGFHVRDGDDDRDTLEDERFEAFRDSVTHSVLPNLPNMAGYHVCWLTTSNLRDSIINRQRMGYELIRATDLPGYDWSQSQMKTGDYAGVIAVNEMVAARIPISLYNRFMREVHHDQPLAEEEKLYNTVAAMKDEAERMGSYIEMGDGTAGVVQRAKPMVFTE